MSTLKPLSKITFPNLVSFDRDSLVNEMISIIESDPDWEDISNGIDLHQNATNVIMQLFTFLAEKNATSFNKQLREMFLLEAKNDKSIYDRLYELGVGVVQATSSSVTVRGDIQNEILTETLYIPRFTQLTGADLNGNQITLEFIKFDAASGKFNYFDDIAIVPSVTSTSFFEVSVHAGETFRNDFEIVGNYDNFKISLTGVTDIVEDSIRVYYQKGSALVEMIESDSFVVAPVTHTSFPDGVPHYKIKPIEEGGSEIYFGSDDFGGAFDPDLHQNGNLIVFGRTGGGKLTNITKGSIAQTLIFELSAVKDITIFFSNRVDASGGADRESIFEAQTFGPMRVGSGDSVVTEKDSLNRLRQYITKHKVISPKYSEVGTNVPVLHCHHYIAPIRDLSTFSLPTPTSTDTASTYYTRFLQALNTFLNVVGAHSAPITGEVVSNFYYAPNTDPTNFSFTASPTEDKPLSGTITIKALDVTDTSVDELNFDGAYSGSTNIPEINTDHALVRTFSFTSLSIGTINNKIKLQFDDYSTSSQQITITFPEAVYTPVSFAAYVQSQMVTHVATESMFTEFPGYTYSYVDPDDATKVIIESPSVGYNSKLEVLELSASDSLYDVIEFTVGIYRPSPRSGLVFTNGCNYDYANNVISYLINNNDFDQTYTYDGTTDPTITMLTTQDSSQETGPSFVHTIYEEDNTELVQPFINSDIVVTAYDGVTPVKVMTYTSIKDSDTNSSLVSADNTNNVFKIIEDNNYDYDTSRLTINFVDGIEKDKYKSTFDVLTSIKLFNFTDDPTYTSPLATWSDTKNWEHPDIYDIDGGLSGYTDNPLSKIRMTGSSGLDKTDLLAGMSDDTYDLKVTVGTGTQQTISIVFLDAGGQDIDQSADSIDDLATVIQTKLQALGTVDSYDYSQMTVTVNEVDDASVGKINFLIDTNTTDSIALAVGTVNTDLVASLTDVTVISASSISDNEDKLDVSIVDLIVTTKTYHICFYDDSGTPAIIEKWAFTYTSGSDSVLSSVLVATNPIIDSGGTNQYVFLDDAISFEFVDGEYDPNAVKFYETGITDDGGTPIVLTSLGVEYRRKSYDYIAMDYTPNPYFPEGEALILQQKLMADDRRMIGMEHVLKKINFIPMGIQGTLTVKNGASPSETLYETETLIKSNYSYENVNSDHSIGSGFSTTKIKSTVTNSELNPGFSDLTFTEPTSNTIDTSTDGNYYYFILDDEVISKIETLEASYTGIAGLANTLKVSLATTQEE